MKKYAVLRIKGSQYKVSEGEEILVDKLNGKLEFWIIGVAEEADSSRNTGGVAVAPGAGENGVEVVVVGDVNSNNGADEVGNDSDEVVICSEDVAFDLFSFAVLFSFSTSFFIFLSMNFFESIFWEG